MTKEHQANVNDIPLNKIDVSLPELFLNDTWQPWFARLRKEAPVHYLDDSANGPFWSVTSHQHIKEVDMNNEIFPPRWAEFPSLSRSLLRARFRARISLLWTSPTMPNKGAL